MTVRGGLRWQPGLKMRLRSYKTWLKSLELTLLRRILVLTNFKKRNDELTSLLNKEKEDAVVEFRAFKQFIDFLDTNYVAGFEDFCMDAMENFHEVDFSSIKLSLGATKSSLFQPSFENINIEDDDTNQPAQDDPNVGDDPL